MTKRILVVDDEPDICEILRFNLDMIILRGSER